MKIFWTKDKLYFVNFYLMKLIIFISFITLISCKQSKTENQPSDKEEIVVPTNKNLEGNIKFLEKGCGYDRNLNGIDSKIYLPDVREKKIIENIISYAGLPLNFQIFSGDINNAIAFNLNDKRYIIYDKNLLNNVDSSTYSYWSSISILAHEIGHHLSGHTLNNNEIDKHEKELQADKFSGFILYKMGASQQQSTNAMELLGGDIDTESHPNKRKRIQSILEGWNEARTQRYQGAIPPPPNDNPDDFYEFTPQMLIRTEFRDRAIDLYEGFYDINNRFAYGVITDVKTAEEEGISSFTIRIFKTTKEFEESNFKFDNNDFLVNVDTYRFGDDNETCNACEQNFETLIVPGRRLKFSVVQSCADCGSHMNGVWFLTYAKAQKTNDF
jgi:hypothetical protein